MNEAYERAVARFAWDIPHQLNLGESLCDRQPRTRVAIIAVDRAGATTQYTFGDLASRSNRFANALAGLGCTAGDRVAVLLPASVEAAIAHIAILKAGMISVPLIADAGSDYMDRLALAGVTAICTTASMADIAGAQWRQLSSLRQIIVLRDDEAPEPGARMEATLANASDYYQPIACAPVCPALLSFTSGSEGKPKGVLQSHSLVLGIVPALLFTGLPKPEDIVWSHFDWGWLGGLLVAFGAWYFGSAVVVQSEPALSPGRTIDLLRRLAVTRVSIAPTALKIMQHGTRGMAFPKLSSITTGGEKLDPATAEWVLDRFGIELSEIYGLTECSAVMGSGQLVPRRRGALGKPAPGQRVQIVDEDGSMVATGEVGQIALRSPHPAMFLGYWQDQEATRARFRGDLLMSGDLARQDEEGYYHYISRADDIIKRGGKRIGPGEIESAFAKSAAVNHCAAVGVPDTLAGERIVLWVELDPSCPPTSDTEARIMTEARDRLPTYQLPDEIRFVEAMPLTSSGKVHRRAVREAEMNNRA